MDMLWRGFFSNRGGSIKVDRDAWLINYNSFLILKGQKVNNEKTGRCQSRVKTLGLKFTTVELDVKNKPEQRGFNSSLLVIRVMAANPLRQSDLTAKFPCSKSCCDGDLRPLSSWWTTPQCPATRGDKTRVTAAGSLPQEG